MTAATKRRRGIALGRRLRGRWGNGGRRDVSLGTAGAANAGGEELASGGNVPVAEAVPADRDSDTGGGGGAFAVSAVPRGTAAG